MQYVIVDLEMCRIPKDVKKIKRCMCDMETIEIGAVIMEEDGNISDQFDLLVHPEWGHIDSLIRNLTGISQDKVKNAVEFEEAIKQFLNWVPKDAVMVSWSDSDKYQLRRELRDKGLADCLDTMTPFFDQWLDAQHMFAQKLKEKRALSLKEALLAADIDVQGKCHNGLDDAYNTAQLLKKMLTEKELKLNEYYYKAKYEKVEHLSSSLGDLMKGIVLEDN